MTSVSATFVKQAKVQNFLRFAQKMSAPNLKTPQYTPHQLTKWITGWATAVLPTHTVLWFKHSARQNGTIKGKHHG